MARSTPNGLVSQDIPPLPTSRSLGKWGRRIGLVVLIIGVCGVLIGLLMYRLNLANWLSSSERAAVAHSHAPEAAPKNDDAVKKALQIAHTHLQKAAQKCDQAMEQPLQQVDALFRDASRGVPEFVDSALGWSSQFRWLWDRLPFTDSDGHRKMLQARFQQYVLSEWRVKICIESVCRAYLQNINSIENQMLVDMQSDLADYPEIQKRLPLDPEKFNNLVQQHWLKIHASVNPRVNEQVIENVVHVIIIEVSARIMTKITKLAWGGIVIGLVIDWILGEIWDAYADPKGKLCSEINNGLEQLKRDIKAELTQELKRLAQERAQLRQEVIEKSILMSK
jgi:hypothetical protein